MSANLEQLKSELMTVHKEFQDTLNEGQKEFAKKGDVDALVTEKEKALNDKIGELEKAIKAIERDGVKTSAVDKEKNVKEQYERAWEKWARGKLSDDRFKSEVENLSKDAHTDLSIDDNGFVVADSLEAGVYAVLNETTEMRRFAQVRSAGNEEYRKIIRSQNAASNWVGEKTERPNLDAPNYEEFRPSFGEIYSNPEVTQKMLDDSSFDLVADLTESIGEEFSETEGNAFVTGNGSNKPKGILTYDAGTQWGQIAQIDIPSGFEYQDILNFIHSLPARYRRGAAWIMNSLTLSQVRGVTDKAGNSIFQPDITNGDGYRGLVLGYPVMESEDMPDIAPDALALGFADFSRAYTIVDVRGIRMLRDPYTNKPFVSFYSTKRVGGGVRDFRAIKLGKIVGS